MNAILWYWLIAAAVTLCSAILVGLAICGRVTGVLIDSRGRYSLTHFQITVWTVTIVSLIAGTFLGRWQHHVPDPLNFTIPNELLGVLGISLGSGVLATTVKTTKDAKEGVRIAASEPRKAVVTESTRPRFSQIFMQEEGGYADQVVDIAKFQNFLFTLVLVTAYVGAVIAAVHHAGSVAAFTALPGFAGTFLTLLGISHGAYVAGKIPPQQGIPVSNLETRNAARRAAMELAVGHPAAPPGPVAVPGPVVATPAEVVPGPGVQ
jgi:hypothetical protein